MKNSSFLVLFAGIVALSVYYLKNSVAKAEGGSSELTFESSYANAITKATRTHKPIVLIFSTAWCGHCKQMKREVYPSDEVNPFAVNLSGPT